MGVNDAPALRLLMVWEGLVAAPRNERSFTHTSLRLRLTPGLALRRWVTDSRMTARLRDAADYSPYVMDVVTFFGSRAADAIEDRMREEHVAFGEMLYADDPRALSDMNVEHIVVYHGVDAYKGLLGDGEIFLWNPSSFDLPAV